MQEPAKVDNRCKTCDGTRQVVRTQTVDGKAVNVVVKCPDCASRPNVGRGEYLTK